MALEFKGQEGFHGKEAQLETQQCRLDSSSWGQEHLPPTVRPTNPSGQMNCHRKLSFLWAPEGMNRAKRIGAEGRGQILGPLGK